MPYCQHYSETSVLFKGTLVKSIAESEDGIIHACLEMPLREHICPYCGCTTSKIKDYRIQKIKDVEIIGKKMFIFLRKRRYYCARCHKTFTENNPLVARYQRVTIRFYQQVYKELMRMQSFKSVAERMDVSVTSVIRWFDHISYAHANLPARFSIDEFKGNTGNEKYQCNITDPVSHKILDILPSRNLERLCAHYRQYEVKERFAVKEIVMDMSNIFRAAAHLLFPNARITADKFHVIRLVSWSMDNVRKRIQKLFYKQKRKWFKRSKNILLRPGYKLSLEEKSILNQMLSASSELEKAYTLKELFYKAFRKKSKRAAARQLRDWLLLAAESGIPEFAHCIDTFTKWRSAIINIVESKLTNGFTEGINNKIKVLKRISFGYRNFERFRNRILYLCS